MYCPILPTDDKYFQVAQYISKSFNTVNNIAQSFNRTYKRPISLRKFKYCAKILTVLGPVYCIWSTISGEQLSGQGSAHSPSFQALHLRHSSFSNPSLALPTSQLILQSFCCSTYVTAHSPTFLSLLLRHRIFTYVTWRVAHASDVAVDVLMQKDSISNISSGKVSLFFIQKHC